jgi:chitodextrinase
LNGDANQANGAGASSSGSLTGPAVGILAVVALAAIACGGDHGGPGGTDAGGTPPDSTPPSVPAHLVTQATSPTHVQLSWDPSTDNRAVSGYRIFRDGTFLSASTSTARADDGVRPGSNYCYAVSAVDAAGNESARSDPACAQPIDRPPVAVLDTPLSTEPRTTVTLDGSRSSDPDGTIVTYRFDFGDGSPPQAQATPSVQHAFEVLGTYVISLTVTDEFGVESVATDELTVGLMLDPVVNVSRTPTWSQSPSAFRDPDGGIEVTWEETGNDILFTRSIDGLTFSTPLYVVDPAGPWGSRNDYSSGQMRVVRSGGTIHIVWTVFDTLFGGAEVFHSRSTDDGASFSDPVIVSTVDQFNSYIPAISAVQGGLVDIAWADSNLEIGVDALRYSRSVDDGQSFSSPSTIPTTEQLSCPALLRTDAVVHVAWFEGRIEQERMHYSRSIDGGTFESPALLDDGTQKLWCPLIARGPSGRIFLAWSQGSAFIDERVRLTYSDDQGTSFVPPVAISPVDQDVVCPSLAVAPGGRILITWTGTNHADSTLKHGYLIFSDDGGRSFSPPLRIRSAAPEPICPQLLAEDQGVAFIWNPLVQGNVLPDILYAHARLLTGP